MTIQEKYDYTYDTLSIIETKTEEEQSIFFEFICEDLLDYCPARTSLKLVCKRQSVCNACLNEFLS